LYSVHKGYVSDPKSARLRYEDNRELNSYIDDNNDEINIFEYSLIPSEVLFNTDPVAYKELLTVFIRDSESGES
jgi:hypothetical protein